MSTALISKCQIEFPKGTPNTIFDKVTELLKADNDFYGIVNDTITINFEISGYGGIDYDGVKEIQKKALELLEEIKISKNGFIFSCNEFTSDEGEGYFFEFEDVEHWFDNYLDKSDRELLEKELNGRTWIP